MRAIGAKFPRIILNCEPANDKTYQVACAPSEDSTQSDQSLRCPHEQFLGPYLLI